MRFAWETVEAMSMARVLQDVITLLNQLIQAEYDSVDARRAVVTPPLDPGLRDAMLADHRAHVDDLAVVVRNLGGEPLSHGDLRRLLPRGRGRFAPADAGDGAFDLLRRYEENARDVYQEAASLPGIPVDVQAVLERLLDDELRHLSWLAPRRTSVRPRP